MYKKLLQASSQGKIRPRGAVVLESKRGTSPLDSIEPRGGSAPKQYKIPWTGGKLWGFWPFYHASSGIAAGFCTTRWCGLWHSESTATLRVTKASDGNRLNSLNVPHLHLIPLLSVSTTPGQSMQLLPQHVRHNWPMTSGSTGGFPSPAFAVSPVLDATGSDYVYLAIEDSVRPLTRGDLLQHSPFVSVEASSWQFQLFLDLLPPKKGVIIEETSFSRFFEYTKYMKK